MNHEYLTTYHELDRLVNILLSNPNDWLGCDTETTGLDCHTCVLSTVQISSQSLGHTYVIDVFKIPDWPLLFTRLTAQKKFNWAFHNFKFDLKFFWKVGIDFQHCKVVDTMIVSGLLTAGLNMDNDLKSVADRYLNIQLDKEEQRSDWSKRPLSDSQIYYAAMDADTTRLLGKKLVKLVKSENITEVFKLEMRALPSFASMEYYGTQLDLVKLEHLRPIYEEKLRVARETFLGLIPGRYVRYNCLGNIVDEGLDLKSPSQVLQVLRDAGVPNPLYDPKGRKPETVDPLLMSTGSNTLKLLNVTDYVLLENLMAYRKASKLLDAYIYSLPKLINSVTGRLHTHFRQSVSTGRASSSSPNLQNLSRPDGSETNLRSCFTPTEGYVLLDGDYCIAEGTRVSTVRGTVPIEYVKEGDAVYQDTGTTQKVLRVISKGHLPVKRIITKYGYEIDATDEHKFRVLDNGEYVWKRVGDLKISDNICITAGRASNIETYVSMPEVNYQHANEKHLVFPSHLDEELACFLGYMAGDGSFTSKGISWVVCDKDLEVFDAINEYAIRVFGRIGSKSSYRGILEAGISSVPLARVLGFIGASKTTVPDSMYRSPVSVIQAYLRGLFESDGSVCDRVSFSSTSKSFIKEVQQLLLICGMLSVISSPKMSKLATKQLYILALPSAFTQEYEKRIGFMSTRKLTKLRKLASGTNKSPSIGNMPIPKSKLLDADLAASERYILRNSINLDRPVSLLTAAELYAQSPLTAMKLELHRPILYNQYFVPVLSIDSIGESMCYDLEVEKTHTYISNGFVSHNSQIELRVVAEVIYKLSNDRKMLDEFIAGKDPYVATAALLSGMRYEDMVDDTDTVLKIYKLLRQQAKAVRLGFNYCLAGGTLVPTDKGVLRIKDIKIGDEVLTHTGNYRTVTDTQKVYTDELIKVTTSTGKSLMMTPDHKLLVMSPKNNKQLENDYRWVDARSLVTGNYLVPNSTEYKMPDIAYFTNIAHAKLLGWFLSEGCYSNGLFYIAQCPIANPVIHKEMRDTLEPLGFFRYEASLDRFYVHKRSRVEFMKYINVDWKAKSRKKSFQYVRELLTRNERLAVLGALWDGDGCISISNSKVSITYHSLSITLMRDIQYLLDSLGLNSRVYKRETGLYDLRIIGSRSMRKFLDIIPTHKKHKAKGYVLSSVRTEERVSTVEMIESSAHPMYDITVDTDHSFIANGVVSHNCMGAPKFKSYAKTTYGVTFTEQEAAANRAMYFNSYPGLNVYHNSFKDKDIRVVHTLPPFKRPRYFAEYPGISALSNHPIQGCLNYRTSRVKTNLGYLSIEMVEKLNPSHVWTGTEWATFNVVNRGPAQLAQIQLKNSISLDCDVRHEVLTIADSGYEFKKFNELLPEDKICTSLAKPLEYGIDYSDGYLEV